MATNLWSGTIGGSALAELGIAETMTDLETTATAVEMQGIGGDAMAGLVVPLVGVEGNSALGTLAFTGELTRARVQVFWM